MSLCVSMQYPVVKVGGNGQERSSSKTFSPGTQFRYDIYPRKLFRAIFKKCFLQFVAILSYFFAISDNSFLQFLSYCLLILIVKTPQKIHKKSTKNLQRKYQTYKI